MIDHYSEQAANERTFLAWLRTGIAIVAFGFLIEKFKLFAATAAKATNLDEPLRLQLEKFSGSFSQGAGRWLTVLGISFMAIATVRFIRTARMLDDQKMHPFGVLTDVALSAILAAFLAGISIYLVFG
jgi:inner membrane protein YidH